MQLNTLNSMQTQFVDINKLATQLSLDNLPLAEQEKVIGKLEEEINDKVNLAIIEQLPEQERENFLNIVNTGTPEDVKNYLNSQIPDLELLVKNIAVQIVEEFKSK